MAPSKLIDRFNFLLPRSQYDGESSAKYLVLSIGSDVLPKLSSSDG